MTDHESLDLWSNLDDEDGPTDEVSEAAEGEERLAARLPDGSGFLIVEGPGAGSIVTKNDDSQVREAPALPDRDAALDGDRPIFLVHRSKNWARSLPRLLANVHAAVGNNVALGVASGLPNASELAHQEFNASCAAAAVRIVDPHGCFTRPGDLRLPILSARRQSRAPYLTNPQATVKEIVDLQRDRGANLLLTPGYALDPAEPQRSLDAACDVGDEALAALGSGERLALNLTMSSIWLTRAPLRDALLDQLLDQEQFETWYIRVQWSSSVRSQAQPTDEELLRGYRRLSELAADEDRRLFLPQTGLTGWLMLGFGAKAFGSGLSGSEQAFREHTNGGRQPLERYFERQLLHTIERTAQPILAADQHYTRCTCPYCPRLFSGGGWSHEYAGLHQLFCQGELAASAAASAAGRRGPHGAVRRTVRAAVRFASNKPLAALSDPQHLQVWDRVL